MTDDIVDETGAGKANAMLRSVIIAAANKAVAVFVPETDNATVTGYVDEGTFRLYEAKVHEVTAIAIIA